MLNCTLKKLLVCSAIMLGVAKAEAQQTFSYTQYMENLTPLNPAYSLMNKNTYINAIVRKQWINIDGAPTSYYLNGSMPLENINGSAGIIASNYTLSVEHLTEASAFFAKSIQFSETQHLGVSLSAGFRNYVANYNQLDPTDPNFRDNVKQFTPNLGFGVLYYSDHYYVGVSLPEINIRSLGNASLQENNNFRNHYYLSAGYTATLDDEFKIKPAALMSVSRGVPVIADFSTTLYMKNAFGIGINYRTNNEIAGIVSFDVDVFHFGYSYQVGTSNSDIGKYSNATNEVSLGIRFGKSPRSQGTF